MNIATLILSQGAADSIAIQNGSASMTYSELRARVAECAHGLLNRGWSKGERVVILAENSAFFVITYLAVIQTGLVAVPLPVDASETYCLSVFKQTEPKAIFLSQQVNRKIRKWIDKWNIEVLVEKENIPGEGASMQPPSFPNVEARRDLAAIMFTSGSTGVPKGVMITHRNIECNTRDIISYMGLTSADRVLVVLPFHYCFGLSLLQTHLMVGGTLVLSRQFVYPEQTVKDLRDTECTGLAGVPSTYQWLLGKSRFGEMTFPKLRWFQVAGGKLEMRFQSQLLKLFPGVQLFNMYGQTEATARLSYLPPEMLPAKMGSIGKGLPSTQLQVLKENGAPVVVGSSEIGEVVATGDNVALGYWNDPAETAQYFQEGRLRTGDLARVDAEGFIYLVERARDMIKSRGNRVSPAEIEAVIADLAAVAEVAVTGMPHDLWGETICAFVVLTTPGSITCEHVKNHCSKRLPAHKTPEAVVFIERMPYNSAGKIAKKRLLSYVDSPLVSSVPIRDSSKSSY